MGDNMSDVNINKNRINDIINIYAETLGITDKRIINSLKNGIYLRCKKYKESYPVITINQDDDLNYILKPNEKGEYSLEDFFLNRMMLGLRGIDVTDSLEGTAGEYTAALKSLSVNVPIIKQNIMNSSARNILNSEIIRNKIIKKTFQHELGHLLKTRFTGNYKAPLGQGREQDLIYANLIDNLKSYNNGIYAKDVRIIGEMSQSQEESAPYLTGVNVKNYNYRKKNKDSYINNNYRNNLDYLDELLNEQEALDLTDSTVVHKQVRMIDSTGNKSLTGNYINSYNYLSGYRSFTGYGEVLEYLLGDKMFFYCQYISPETVFNKFDQMYSDIVREMFHEDLKAIDVITFYIHKIKKNKAEEDYLLLDHFFAKCYEKKFNMYLSRNKELTEEVANKILRQIDIMEHKLTTNDNPEVRASLAHMKIFAELKTKIKKNTKVDDYQQLLTELDDEESKVKVTPNNSYYDYVEKACELANAISNVNNDLISKLYRELCTIENSINKVDISIVSENSSLDVKIQEKLFQMKKALKKRDIESFNSYLDDYHKLNNSSPSLK